MNNYVPIEYPKWVDGVLVQNAAQEQTHRAALAEAAEVPVPPSLHAPFRRLASECAAQGTAARGQDVDPLRHFSRPDRGPGISGIY